MRIVVFYLVHEFPELLRVRDLSIVELGNLQSRCRFIEFIDKGLIAGYTDKFLEHKVKVVVEGTVFALALQLGQTVPVWQIWPWVASWLVL